eukprot:5034715-Amphidinium_carterae.1
MPPFAIVFAALGGGDAPAAASCCTAAWAHALSHMLPEVLWMLAAMSLPRHCTICNCSIARSVT